MGSPEEGVGALQLGKEGTGGARGGLYFQCGSKGADGTFFSWLQELGGAGEGEGQRVGGLLTELWDSILQM